MQARKLLDDLIGYLLAKPFWTEAVCSHSRHYYDVSKPDDLHQCVLWPALPQGRDGLHSQIICNLTATRFEGPDGTIGIVEAFKDITDIKRVQEEIQSERDRLHRILFHQFENVGIVNDQYQLEYQNELLKEQTGGEENCLCYAVLRDRQQPCDDCLMQQAITTDKIQRFEFDIHAGRSFQHTYTPFTDNDGQKKALVSQRDITKRRTSTAAAIRSEHLAAIGELAAGVAHEINNPVNGIINYGQMMVNKTDTDNFLNNISQRIIKEGERIAVIVKSLLSFARQDSEKKDLVRINDLIEDSLTLTRAQLRKDGILLSLDLDEDTTPFPASMPRASFKICRPTIPLRAIR